MKQESISKKHDNSLSTIATQARTELEKLYRDGESMTMFVSQEKMQHELVLPSHAVSLLMDVLEQLSLHKAVSVVAHDKMLTTQQVADFLRVSRPFITKLIDAGDLECTMVGTHRRIKFENVKDYKERMDAERRKILCDLAFEAQELDMGY